MNSDKNLILFIIEGLGLSVNQANNAFLPPNAPNFFRLWRDYKHKAVTSRSTPDDKSSYFRLSTGLDFKQYRKNISESLKPEHLRTDEMKKLFDSISRHKSSLHLIVPLKVVDNKQWLSILDLVLSKCSKYFIPRVFLHVVVESDVLSPRNEKYLDLLEEFLSQHDSGEIGTLIKLKEKYDEDDKKNIHHALLSGFGCKALSPRQALKKLNEAGNAIVCIDSTKNKQISNFDGLLSIDCEIDFINPLLHALFSSPPIFSRKIFQYLFIFSFFRISAGEFKDINYLFEIPEISYLPSILKKNGIETAIISEETKRETLETYFDGNLTSLYETVASPSDDKYLTEFENTISSIIAKTLNFSKKNKKHLIVCSIPSIVKVCNLGNFHDIVKIVSVIDKHLGVIESEVIKSGGRAIIFSPYGMCEAISYENIEGKRSCKINHNPLPIIDISHNNLVSSHEKKDLLSELLNATYNRAEIFTSILAHFNVKI